MPYWFVRLHPQPCDPVSCYLVSLSKAPQPPQTVLLARDQVSKHLSLWRTFHANYSKKLNWNQILIIIFVFLRYLMKVLTLISKICSSSSYYGSVDINLKLFQRGGMVAQSKTVQSQHSGGAWKDHMRTTWASSQWDPVFKETRSQVVVAHLSICEAETGEFQASLFCGEF